MKQRIRALAALVIALCMLAGAACADGVGDVLTRYFDGNAEVRFTARIELETLMPYGDDTIEMMNALLGHVWVNATVLEDSVTAAIGAEDATALTFTEQPRTGGGTEMQLDLLPNRTLTSQGSAMDAFSGSESEETPFDTLAAVAEAQANYRALTDAIAPYGDERSASYKITSIGSARWRRLAKLSAEDAATLHDLIGDVLCSGMDADYRTVIDGLTYQKNLTIALYQTEQGGKDMAVYIKGDVLLADGSKAKLSYQWAFKDEGTDRTDTYKFELVKSARPRDDRLVESTYKQTRLSDRFTLNGTETLTLRTAEGTTVTTTKHDLSGKNTDGAQTLTGTQSVAVKTTADGETETVTTTYTPELTLTSAEGSGVLSGSVRLEEKVGKKTLTALTIRLDDEPAQALLAAWSAGELFAVEETVQPTATPESSLTVVLEAMEEESDFAVGKAPIGLTEYTVPASMQTIDLDTASPETLASLLGEASQNLAGRLLICLAALPEEDTALLRDNMSEADYAQFLSIVQGL